MEKPSDVIGRDREWRTLQRFLQPGRDDGLRLGIVSGRRRAGKTFLLTALGRASNGLYHVCVQDEGDLAARRRFAAAISAYAGLDSNGDNPGSWESLLKAALTTAVRQATTDAPPLVIIDEFPYALDKAPEMAGVLQLLYDQSRRGEAPGGNIILCGSALSVMRELLSGTKPLRGRAVVDLRLGPLDFRQTAQLWDIPDPETALRLHACVGGYPGYRQLIDTSPQDHDDFEHWVPDNLLSSGLGVFTHAEVDYLLKENPRITDRAVYYDILSAIATGSTSLAKIGGAVGRSKESVRMPLQTLLASDYVTMTPDLVRKRNTVTVSDPIIRFDRLITAPHLGQLELGRAAEVWRTQRHTFASQILGPHFEEISRDWVRRFAPQELERPEGFGDVASANLHDHKGRAKHEVDVLGLAGKRITFIGEAKTTLHQPGPDAIERLQRIGTLLGQLGYDAGAATLGVFSRTGFSPALTALVRADSRLELIDLDRLYRG